MFLSKAELEELRAEFDDVVRNHNIIPRCDNEACQMPAETHLQDGTPVCRECYDMVTA